MAGVKRFAVDANDMPEFDPAHYKGPGFGTEIVVKASDYDALRENAEFFPPWIVDANGDIIGGVLRAGVDPSTCKMLLPPLPVDNEEGETNG